LKIFSPLIFVKINSDHCNEKKIVDKPKLLMYLKNTHMEVLIA
jgi:hypothetical protein